LEKKNDSKFKLNWHSLIYVLIGVIIGILAGFAIVVVQFSSSEKAFEKSLSSGESASESDGDADDSVEEVAVIDDLSDLSLGTSGISTYEYDSTILTGDDAQTAKENILTVLDFMKERSTYMNVQVGEDEYNIYIYNKDGECFAQSYDGQYTAVFMKDGTTVKYDASSDIIAVGSDIDFESLLTNVVNAVDSGTEGVTLYEMDFDEEEIPEGYHEYRVDLVGDEAVKLAYTGINETFEDEMLTQLEDDITDSLGEEDWEPHLIYCFIISEGNNLTSYCYVVADGQEYTNWVQDGYLEFSDWTFTDDWYTTDFSSIDTDSLYDMIDDLLDMLEDVMETYADENGLTLEDTSETSTDTDETTEVEVDTEDSAE
jgi:hypothetical protein